MGVLSITNHTLEKLEMLLKTSGYKLRYEKGNFKTGACIIQSSRVIVINKFLGLESRILAISDLACELNFDMTMLDERQQEFLYQLKQTTRKL